MRSPAILLFIVSALLIQMPAVAQCFEYAQDDGTGNFTIGPSEFDANMTWLNSFSALEGGEIISSISVSIGGIDDNNGVLGSDLITVALLDDPNNDGDPSDAILLTTATFQFQDLGTNVFEGTEIAPTEVSGGFFVAIEMDVLQRANPARMDPQGPGSGNESWLFYNPESRLDNLGNSKFILRMSDSPFWGAWMIRADGRGCFANMLCQTPTVDIFDVFEFIELFRAGSFAADFTSDGLIDIFDVLSFIDAFNNSGGC
jgi:hypothetical protein